MQRVSGGLPAHCGAGSRASFAMLWLSFWVRDRRRQTQQVRPTHLPITGLANPQRDLATVNRPLARVGVASGVRLTIDLVSSDVQPTGENDEAVLDRPEHVQHLNDNVPQSGLA